MLFISSFQQSAALDETAKTIAVTLATAGVAWIGRWLLFRLTQDGRFAIGASEEMAAFRKELREEVAKLRQKVDEQERLISDLTIAKHILETKLELAGAHIAQLEIEVKQRDARILQLEEANGNRRPDE